MFTEVQLKNMLTEFCSKPVETEWLEFKEAKQSFSTDEIGEYFSALSNEANLKKIPCGWLIFGIKDKPVPREITGTSYRTDKKTLQRLKHEISVGTGGITFIEIYDLEYEGKRVIMFQIPPAISGYPTMWKQHYYGRAGESIGGLSMDEIDRIRNVTGEDWTACVAVNATKNDLDEQALEKARLEYKQKNEKSSFYHEIDEWDNMKFLNKIKLATGEALTNAAIILLGRPESAKHIQPAVARLTWILKDKDGLELDYAHFDPPFVLNVDKLLSKIRNLTLRELPDGTLFPVEISQYDQWVMREALHNCIAHQDYKMNCRVTIVETPISLLFVNTGRFIPGSIENVLQKDAPSAYYPNRCLTDAMVELKMIDTIGSGIKRMFQQQKKRFMPLPEYDLSEGLKVKVTLSGYIIDKAYTKLLMKIPELSMDQVILLDKVQKKHQISKVAADSLRKDKLVEGRYPNIFVSADIAGATGEKAAYIRNRGLNDMHYIQLIIEYLKEYDSASRADIDKLLMDKLPDVLSEEQKKHKINRLVSNKLRGQIENTGSRGYPKWKLKKIKEN